MRTSAACWTSIRVSMNVTAGWSCRVFRKWFPTADCKTSLTRFNIVPTIEMTFGARVSGTWICTWSSMENTKPSRLLPSIGAKCASRLCDALVSFDQFNVRIDVGTISGA